LKKIARKEAIGGCKEPKKQITRKWKKRRDSLSTLTFCAELREGSSCADWRRAGRWKKLKGVDDLRRVRSESIEMEGIELTMTGCKSLEIGRESASR